ncbi:MAG: SRPBCC family protein [Ilumatobacteraceae bacterium]
MDLHHEFTVPVPAADAWRILTNLERLAPCLPGAQLTEVEGEIYRGQVKVKVGPIIAQFKGQASFVTRDDANYTASLKAEGRDTGGKGNAAATITARLESTGPSSAKCTVDTDLNITGKVAQFGRGALADVSDKLLLQFVDNLNALIAKEGVAGGADASAASGTAAQSSPVAQSSAASEPSSAAQPTVRKIEQSDDVAPLDLLDAAGGTIFKRLTPVLVVIAVAVAAFVIFR